MKKIFLLLSLILGMEATFPSVISASTDNSQDSQATLALVYKELNSIHGDIESAKDAIKLNWSLWGLGILTIICSIATIHYAKSAK
ncbi:hypothetical protein [Candidatus Azobacteroides pseudotrichonymphae]|uniref:hypothetical protein n=1 Tax=Candidatus Azobacteroides pseudotrichonymphae TaxID=511435 RepID=UPI0005A2B9E4|nr:hypothetical protein [Candidatus Azobacteroides pseudotrichonymphae]